MSTRRSNSCTVLARPVTSPWAGTPMWSRRCLLTWWRRSRRSWCWDGHYEQVALVLPDLIAAGRAAVAGEVPGAWWCLAGAYPEASGLARTFGEADLACVAEGAGWHGGAAFWRPRCSSR